MPVSGIQGGGGGAPGNSGTSSSSSGQPQGQLLAANTGDGETVYPWDLIFGTRAGKKKSNELDEQIKKNQSKFPDYILKGRGILFEEEDLLKKFGKAGPNASNGFIFSAGTDKSQLESAAMVGPAVALMARMVLTELAVQFGAGPAGKMAEKLFAKYSVKLFQGSGKKAIIKMGEREISEAELRGLIRKFAAEELEGHHLLPREFEEKFAKAGLNIEEYVIDLNKARHRLKPDGLHTGKGAENWNGAWREFFRKHPNASRKQILGQLCQMKKDFGLE